MTHSFSLSLFENMPLLPLSSVKQDRMGGGGGGVHHRFDWAIQGVHVFTPYKHNRGPCSYILYGTLIYRPELRSLRAVFTANCCILLWKITVWGIPNSSFLSLSTEANKLFHLHVFKSDLYTYFPIKYALRYIFVKGQLFKLCPKLVSAK